MNGVVETMQLRAAPMRPLTDRQAQMLAIICRSWICGRSPTLRELGAAMGIRSNNGVLDHVAALERRELIDRRTMKSALSILPKGWAVWASTMPEFAGPDEAQATMLAYAAAARVSLGQDLEDAITSATSSSLASGHR